MNEEEAISKEKSQDTENFKEETLVHEVLESRNKILGKIEGDKLPDFEHVPSPPPYQEDDK